MGPPAAGPAQAAGATTDAGDRAGARAWRRAPHAWRRAAPWLAVAALPWAASRVAVLAALAAAHVLVSHTHPDAATAARVHQGLLGWDAGWYQAIAAHGYGGAGHQSLRFWPLLPLLGRALATVPGISPGIGVLVVANAAQLLGVAVLARLAAAETGDVALARRAAWLASVVPAAFVSVMGYAEPLLLVTTAWCLLALRRRRWWWAAAGGLLAALTRPLGVALVAPALIEVGRPWWEPRWQAWRASRGVTPASPGGSLAADRSVPVGRATADRSGPAGRLAAVLAPLVGTGAFLGWVGWRYGDALAPLRIQEEPRLHGRLSDPLVTLAHDAVGLFHHHLGEAMHVPWVVLALVLLVVAARRLPASYTAFALLVLAAAVSGPNLDSFERYAASAFPLLLAGAVLTASARVERVVLVLAAAGLFGCALLAFTNVLVP